MKHGAAKTAETSCAQDSGYTKKSKIPDGKHPVQGMFMNVCISLFCFGKNI
jgi:hypothetical protein